MRWRMPSNCAVNIIGNLELTEREDRTTTGQTKIETTKITTAERNGTCQTTNMMLQIRCSVFCLCGCRADDVDVEVICRLIIQNQNYIN